MNGSQWSPQVYSELRTSARRLLQRERRAHTLQPTALVHEAWLKLASRDDAAPPREQLVALAVTAMRRVLIDSARRHRAKKRGSGISPSFSSIGVPPPHPPAMPLHEALQVLGEADPQLASLVELRMGGHGVAAIGRLLGLSPRTVKRRWRFARAWLARELRRQLQ